ncbi:hypothetical protein TVAG_325990 [Trichomonas vaginalis G3]|uniref:Uncharacterized protein n=1 Tax=Trichomonas vaginalis (strain ATCC PRA-98 / G3) TaxID=412133 RepID=A2G8Q6_TRIV3|nr:hypothetical protein TVAGG3_0741230 [Trichomonas vaginalis G3]EAX86464.1 hypothetical protein TVAG_325990 [Trichomonas vaginalis G3]KAI5511896.1 hypothetical protein TVAGG3_0741230 [Trichomonas vaginalis G3]|eukprot:XP_001299394.1 hypothetical protein [Trichomonas vaginalis G3]
MFVIPTDIHGQMLKPNIYNIIETKPKKPNRIAKLTIPPNVQFPIHKKPSNQNYVVRPLHHPPCIEKILQKMKNQINEDSDSEAN